MSDRDAFFVGVEINEFLFYSYTFFSSLCICLLFSEVRGISAYIILHTIVLCFGEASVLSVVYVLVLCFGEASVLSVVYDCMLYVLYCK